ncbi:MAG: hypothetical protein Q9167_003981 [Letrouitia subvulpina]
MRNIKNVLESRIKGGGLQKTVWDVATNSIISASKIGTLQQLSRWTLEGSLERIGSWDTLSDDALLNLQYFPDTLSTCLVFARGDIVVVRENPRDGEEKIEIVGSIDAGISSAAWSPDGELLLVVTEASTVLYLTRDFEELENVALKSDDLSVSDRVSVGWGKKETQFKGKRAKELRDPTVPETIDQGTIHPSDHKKTMISWRGDGAYVAVNSIVSERRVIRIYSRESTLESVSEPVNSLLGALSWRPAGNLLAGVQHREDCLDVVFFEKNGLRHGQFSLRLTSDEMLSWGSQTSLQWNVDSTILAVCFKDRVQLWNMMNYHWYLKQEILISSENPRLIPLDVMWHPEQPLWLSIGSSVEMARFKFVSLVQRGPTSPPGDYGVVAVIDGKILKITPLRTANVPPPMALHEISLKENANDIAISTYEEKEAQTLKVALKFEVLHSMGPPSTYGTDITAQNSPCEINEPSIAPTESSIFRLTENGALFAEERLLSRGCTSFVETPYHLIFTTTQHLLKFVHMTAVENMEVPLDAPETDERCRSIEKGAKIITAMPSIFALVLQMSRGNLETIYPRALVLAGIRRNVEEKKYKKAFLACRTQRVDMNILHDYAPIQFIDNVGLFIDDLQKVEHVDLFLSSLREEDVSITMYRETLPAEESRAIPSRSTELEASKVNRICDAFLLALRDRDHNFKNLITAQVCRNPPNLDAGLLEIAALRPQGREKVDEAVEHICFLADVNRLYDNALGLYDLQLAVLIAQHAQKDPKEYLPFLQNLHKMSQLRRQFSIDDYLGRYQKALKHLYGLDAFDEVKTYLSKHGLYKDALDFYRYKDEKYSVLMQMYAEYLQSQSQYKDAGTAFQYLNDYTKASNSYRLAHLWEESLSCASLIPLPNDQLRSLAEALASDCTESKDFFSAATIHLDYLTDVPSAAKMFCKGYFFREAFRSIVLHQQPQLLSTVLDPGLLEGMATMTGLLADCKNQLNAQVPRICDLRVKKAEDPLAFFEGDIDDSADIPDNISLAPTDASTIGGSLFTRYTNRSSGTVATNATRRTSKNRRREERRRARGKKGSVYEEEYLVNSVRRLIERVDSAQDEVRRLVEWLMKRGMAERARAVEGMMVETVALCRCCIGKVFTADNKENGDGGTVLEPVLREYKTLPFHVHKQ